MHGTKQAWLGDGWYDSKSLINNRFKRARDQTPFGKLKGADEAFIFKLSSLHPKFAVLHVFEPVSARNGKHAMGSNAVFVTFNTLTPEGESVVRTDSFKSEYAAHSALYGLEEARTRYEADTITHNARNAVDTQRFVFKISGRNTQWQLTCAHCKQLFEEHECEVDHAGGDDRTFDALFKQYCTAHNVSASKEFGLTFREDSDAVANWQEYHRNHAQFQILCKAHHYEKSGQETSRRAARKRGDDPSLAVPRKQKKSLASTSSSANDIREVIRVVMKTQQHPSKHNVAVYKKALEDAGFSVTDAQIYGHAGAVRSRR
jgi:hypothetical protein